VGEPEGAPRGELMVTEQVLILANESVISLGSLLDEGDVLIKLFLGGESDTIDSLQGIIGCLSKPVSRRVLEDLEGLDSASVWHVGASAEID
jgi:hypothetical protein